MLEVLDAPMSSNLQDNLATIDREFGREFTIKWGNIEMPVILETVEMLSTGLHPYVLRHAGDIDESQLYVFKIIFIDTNSNDLNNNAYIENIRRSNDISGSNIVKFVLAILKYLGAESAILYDGATIKCAGHEVDLSFMKLVEKGETFYTQLGFEYIKSSNMNWEYNFKSSEQLEIYKNKLVERIQNITITHLRDHYVKILDILVDVTVNQRHSELEILLVSNPSVLPPATVPVDNKYDAIPYIMRECHVMMSMLNTDKLTLVDLFVSRIKENNCDAPLYILEYIFESNLYSIKLGDKCVVRNYAIWAKYLRAIRNNHRFVYYFNK